MWLSWVFVLWGSLALNVRTVEPVLVTDQTVKIKGEQRFFYALEAGDVLTLAASSINGKPIRQISVHLYDGAVVWTSPAPAARQRGTWTVPRRAVYAVRLQSGAPKSLRLQLHRRPKTLSRTRFETQVQWKTVTDTIRRHYWSKTQTVYDTSYPTHCRRVHYRTTQHIHTLANRTERVHSKTHLQSDNSNTLTFALPQLPSDDLCETQLLGVAYWIGVGQEGLDNYNAELKKFLGKVAVQVGQKNLLAGLAIGAYAVVTNPPEGDNIHFTWRNSANTTLDQGNVTAAFGRFSAPLQGPLQVTLSNDNLLNGLNVHLKLVAVVERRHYRQEGYQVRTITPLVSEQTRGKVRLVKRQVPVINNW